MNVNAAFAVELIKIKYVDQMEEDGTHVLHLKEK